MREKRAIQDSYPDDLSFCYGCGRLNEKGLQLKTFSEGEETVTVFEPRPEHTAVPGFVYGGLLASLIDCHGTATAAVAARRARGVDGGPPPRFVTAALHVDFLLPTSMGVPLEIRGRVREMRGRKVVVTATLAAEGKIRVTGKLVAVEMPESMAT